MKVDLNRRQILSVLEIMDNLDKDDLEFICKKKNLNLDIAGVASCIEVLKDVDTSYCEDIELQYTNKYVVRIYQSRNVDELYQLMCEIIQRTSFMTDEEMSYRRDNWKETQDEKYYKVYMLLTREEKRKLEYNNFDMIRL